MHSLELHHGRLFLFNVMVTTAWRAKLCEYHLDNYLAASHDVDEMGVADGEHNLLPSSQHDGRGALLPAKLFVAPETDTVRRCDSKPNPKPEPEPNPDPNPEPDPSSNPNPNQAALAALADPAAAAEAAAAAAEAEAAAAAAEAAELPPAVP